MFYHQGNFILYHCQILAKQAEILRKNEQKYQLFRVVSEPSLRYANKQNLNCRCWELDATHFTVIFAPHCEFLLYLDNFTTNPKYVRNTIITANIGKKFVPPLIGTPKNYSSKNMIRTNFFFWGKS